MWSFLGATALAMTIIGYIDGNLFSMCWNLGCVIFDCVMLGYNISVFAGFRSFTNATKDMDKILKEIECGGKGEPFKEFEDD